MQEELGGGWVPGGSADPGEAAGDFLAFLCKGKVAVLSPKGLGLTSASADVISCTRSSAKSTSAR